ncbi:Monocarboxylate transporter 12 [Pseudolycoriella hygida]|uniref:Monocarboxylate transporter 12 n=1 Tax=Pseudolycoriella hygida TaxID=35572 RepID=A0A9Q0N5N7_9DIPT|nr:Monocarboxylate transporter 12 [Pseudolycoriella hygida]
MSVKDKRQDDSPDSPVDENNLRNETYCNKNHIVNNNNNINDKLVIKNNFLCPTEVTFCDLSDGESSIGSVSGTGAYKQRRRRITSTDTDIDSIMSTGTPKNKPAPNIPDGGYGWVVVFSSVVVSLIADGISFSFGLLYTEFLNYFAESSSKTSWIGSIFLAVPLMSGPIMSNLVDKYGCRKMTIIGGIISGTGFVLASFSNSIEMLYWTFGFLGGLGLGIGYVTAVVAVAFWFDKRRTFATGIGQSGTGIGTFLYAPFTQWLIEQFGWRGTCLILAGTLYNICVCGALMRDPDWLIESNLESRSQSIQTFSNSSVCLDEIKKMLETGAAKETVLETLVTNFNTEANQQITDPDEHVDKKYRSELVLPTYLTAPDFETNGAPRYGSRRSLRKKPEDTIASRNEMLSIAKPIPQANSIKHNLASTETLNVSEKMPLNETRDLTDRLSLNISIPSDKEFTRFNETLNGSRFSLQESPVHKVEDLRTSFRGNSLDILFEKPNEKSSLTQLPHDITITIPSKKEQKSYKHPLQNSNLKKHTHLRYSNYFRNMRIHRNSIHYRGAMLNTHRYRLRASSCPNIYRNSMTTLACENEEKWYDSFVDIIKSIFDFSLFLDPKFASFSISTLLQFTWFIVPYFYLPEYMLKYGYTEEQSANVIAVTGVFNTIGMIFLGWTGDQPWLNIPKTYACCLTLCGLSVALLPVFIESYIAIMALGILFGVTFASSFSFTPIILVRLVNLDDFTCAYGLVLLVQGIGNLVGPPIAGLCYELSGHWDLAFYAGGLFIAIAGIFVFITGVLEERDEESDDSSEEDNFSSDNEKHFPISSSGGIDGLRPRHLKDLISFTGGDSSTKLVTAMAKLVNMIRSGKIVQIIIPIFYSAALIALAKKTEDIRPIAIGLTWRRLAGKIGCFSVKEDLALVCKQDDF